MRIGRQASLKSQEVPETYSIHKRPLLGYKNNKQLLGRSASPAVKSSLQEDLQPGKLPASGIGSSRDGTFLSCHPCWAGLFRDAGTLDSSMLL